jgi:hypothetical protein
MPRRKVIDIARGEWTVWRKRERWVCCDCSLVHEVEYRKRDGRLEVRMFRNDRSTAAYRRANGIKVTNGNRRNSRRPDR